MVVKGVQICCRSRVVEWILFWLKVEEGSSSEGRRPLLDLAVNDRGNSTAP